MQNRLLLGMIGVFPPTCEVEAQFTKKNYIFVGNCIKCPEMHTTQVLQPLPPLVRKSVAISLKILLMESA